MTEFAVGDLVEAVKGKRRVIDVVNKGGGPFFEGELHLGEPTMFGPSSIAQYKRLGFTLTVIEKALPPLPTEPGLYVDKFGTDPWLIVDEGARLVCVANRSSDPAKYAPFTRLAPVAEVLGKVREDASCDAVATIAAEYGVTA